MGGEIASGRCVMPTVAGIARWAGRDDIVQVPVTGLPPIPLGLIWVAAQENATIRALAQVALEIGPGKHDDVQSRKPRASPRDTGRPGEPG